MKHLDVTVQDNMQRMLDPCNPLDFMEDALRFDWLLARARHWQCAISF